MYAISLARKLIMQAIDAAQHDRQFADCSHSSLGVFTGEEPKTVVVAVYESKKNIELWEDVIAVSKAQASGQEVKFMSEDGCWKLTFVVC